MEQSRLCRLDNAPLKIPFRPLYGFSNGQNGHLVTGVVNYTDRCAVIGRVLRALAGNFLKQTVAKGKPSGSTAVPARRKMAAN